MNPEEDTEFMQVFLGSMLGDGGLSLNKKNKCKNANYIEIHNPRQKEYLLWKKSIFERYFPVKIMEYKNDTMKGGITFGIRTLSNPFFTKYHSSFYPEGKGNKTFNLKLLKTLSPLGLAVWYQDDGCFNKKRFYVKISTHPNEVKVIKDYFEDLFKSNVYSNKGDVMFNKKQSILFLQIVKEFIHPSMSYKIEPLTAEEDIKEKLLKKDYLKNYREENKDTIKESLKRWNTNNSEKVKYLSNTNYRKRYPLKTELICPKCKITFDQHHAAQEYCSKGCSKNGYLIKEVEE